jgi:hypothetical protein
MQKSPAPSYSSDRIHRFCRRGSPVLWLAVTLASLSGFVVAQTSQTAPPQAQYPAAPPPAASQAFDLADEVVRDVFSNFQRGLETHDLRRLLSVFDAQDMTGYDDFREQMTAFFRLHDNIKFRYQLLQVSADKDVGFAIADVEMDPEPRDTLPTERRQSTQMRFELKRTPAGWRAIALKPMDFFAQQSKASQRNSACRAKTDA